MTNEEYRALEGRAQRCPRGRGVFCDGTPNPIPQGGYEPAGWCRWRKHGRCTYVEDEG